MLRISRSVFGSPFISELRASIRGEIILDRFPVHYAGKQIWDALSRGGKRELAALFFCLGVLFPLAGPPGEVAVAGSSADNTTQQERLRQHDRKLLQQLRQLSRKDLIFSTGNSYLNRFDRQTLQEDAALLRRHPEVEVLLIGHSDERGNQNYNFRLGLARGRSAKRYLTGLGIDPRRIHVVSFGKRSIPGRLLCSDHRESCWRRHRIVHVVGFLPDEVVAFRAPSPKTTPPPPPGKGRYRPGPETPERNVSPSSGRQGGGGERLFVPPQHLHTGSVPEFFPFPGSGSIDGGEYPAGG
uniref:OmpA-like domain-containing protein n=1 Tax=Leptospirillum ferriphilum TaxID=178606 RepID=A0A7C3LTI7_9BACT